MAEENAPLVGRKTTEDIPKAQVGQITDDPPAADEVGGRSMTVRMVRCSNCGGIGYINTDTANFRAYQCNHCASLITF